MFIPLTGVFCEDTHINGVLVLKFLYLYEKQWYREL